MGSEARLFFHDTSVLVNFHRAGYIPVLGSLLGDRVRWTASIRRECERKERDLILPNLVAAADEMLGEPIFPAPEEHPQIRQLRAMMASRGDHPEEHVGEAESITIMQNLRCPVALLSDDRGAKKWAEPIPCIDTWELARTARRRGLISPDDGVVIWRRFVQAGGHPRHEISTQEKFCSWLSTANG